MRYAIHDLRGSARWRDIGRYALMHRPSLPVFIAGVTLVIVVFYFYDFSLIGHAIADEWKQSPVVMLMQIVTLLAVASMWIYELVRDWRDSLPKYLSVDFRYGKRLRIRCRYAPLVGEADARQMAMSLGKEVNKSQFLPIAPTFDRVTQVEQVDASGRLNDGKPFCHYITTIRLTKNIVHLGTKPKKKTDEQEAVRNSTVDSIPDDQFIDWIWPFDPVTPDCLKPCSESDE